MASVPVNPLAPLEDLAYFFGMRSSTIPGFATDEGMDKFKREKIWSDLNEQVLSLLQRSTGGGALASTIIASLTELYDGADPADQELLKQAIGVCAQDAGDFATPQTPKDMLGLPEAGTPEGGKELPNLVAFQIFPTELAFSSRDDQTLDIFFNAIPNIEWSRCVPYFDLLVISSGKPVGTDGIPLTMSQHLFLSPNAALNENDAMLANALPEGIEAGVGEEGERVATVTAAGMELFTSPQTLVNADEEYFEPPSGGEDDRPGLAILDKFRPFMSLKSFNVSVAPSYGMSAYKTAKIALTLHDRSRLAQIAPLVRPDMYGSTELRVEYGWSHPDALNSPGSNPIGEFLNGLRCKEKYRITNSSFTFTEDGQVEVSINLAMKGSTELLTESTTNGEGSASLVDELKKLTEELSSLTKELEGAGSVLEDVSGRTALKAGSSASSALRVDQETKNEIAAFITENKKGGAGAGLKAVADKLQELFGADGKSGKLDAISKAAMTAWEAKTTLLSSRDDAFAAPFPNAAGDGNSGTGPAIGATELGKTKDDYVSLGKILMTVVGKSLQMSNQFDEVQFIFYSFNSLAGFVRHHNIAQFPIKMSRFQEQYKAKFAPTLSTSLQGFIGFLNSEFIQRESSEAYGFQGELYTQVTTGDDKGKWVIKEDLQKDPSDLKGTKQTILAGAYPEGEPVQFRKPQLQMAFECVPVAAPDEENSELTVTKETKTVLRVFVYDKAATAFDPQVTLLSSLSQQNYGIVSANAGTEKNGDGAKFGNQEYTAGHGARLAKIHGEFEDEGIITLFPKVIVKGDGITTIENVVVVNAKGGRLKEFLRKTAPSCIIGSTGNPVNSANLSSMNDPMLASIRIAAATSANKGGIAGDADEGFPTFIQPTQLTVDMFGMPLLAYGSNVFFDFNTSTSVDNFYVCTGVDHSFTPGQFKTTAKFTQIDGFEKFRSAETDVKRQLAMAALQMKTSDEREAGVEAGTIEVDIT